MNSLADPDIPHPSTTSAQLLHPSAASYGADLRSYSVSRPFQEYVDHVPFQALDSPFSAPIGIIEGSGERLSWCKSGAVIAPIQPTALGSVSVVDRRQRYTSEDDSQNLLAPPQLYRYSQPPHNEAHPAVNANTKQHDADSIVPEVDETLSGHVLAAYHHPPDIPDWSQLFNKWTRARRRLARDHWLDDPVLLGLLLASAFDAWLQPRWLLLHNQGLGGPTEDPSRWVRLFDFWLLMPDTQRVLVVQHQQPLSPLVQTSGIVSAPVPIPLPPCLSTQIPARASHRKTRNATSVRTVVAIQQDCEERGGEKEAIQRLEIVFPPDAAISRDALKLKGRSKRWLCGSTRNHRGYLEFAGRREGRHYCRLCGSVSKLWKNEKDLLNHVWNVHCNY